MEAARTPAETPGTPLLTQSLEIVLEHAPNKTKWIGARRPANACNRWLPGHLDLCFAAQATHHATAVRRMRPPALQNTCARPEARPPLLISYVGPCM